MDKAVGGLPASHDISRQNEHGHSNQRGWADTSHHLLDERAHLAEAIKHHYKTDHRTGNQRNHHREAQEQQPDHDYHHYSRHEFLSFVKAAAGSDFRLTIRVAVDHTSGEINILAGEILDRCEEILNAGNRKAHWRPNVNPPDLKAQRRENSPTAV